MNIVLIFDNWKIFCDLKLVEMEQWGESFVVVFGVSGLLELCYCEWWQKFYYVDFEKVCKLGK